MKKSTRVGGIDSRLKNVRRAPRNLNRKIVLNLNLRKPCSNCPFLRDGAINLAPGRLAGIIEDLSSDDGSNCQCHKTVHGKRGGDWIEGEDGGQHYEPSGNESMCIGSAIYMLKVGRPSISMRFALMAKMIALEELTAQNEKIIEPLAQW